MIQIDELRWEVDCSLLNYSLIKMKNSLSNIDILSYDYIAHPQCYNRIKDIFCDNILFFRQKTADGVRLVPSALCEY